MSNKTRNRIAFWIGMAGGGIFMVLNITTNGAVPGGGQGGLLGMFVFGGLAWLVLRFVK
jgi:hypothetical protein